METQDFNKELRNGTLVKSKLIDKKKMDVFLDNENSYDKEAIKKSAERFEKDVFKEKVLEFLEKVL